MVPPVFVPYRDTPGGLRIRNGEVVRRFSTAKNIRKVTHKPIPPATIPDWGLEPAASSWILLRLPLHPLEERESMKPRNVDRESPENNATIMIWDLHCNVDCEQLKSLFHDVDGIVDVFYSNFRRLVLVDFLTRKAAHKARGKMCWLMDRPLKVTFFCNDKYVLNRDVSSPYEEPANLRDISSCGKPGSLRGVSSLCEKPGSFSCTVCIEGFDSSLHVDEIRTILARHFGSDEEGITIPTNLDGSNIGKAFIKYKSWQSFLKALSWDGSYMAGHKLCVTKCQGGDGFWSGYITPDGPGTGKKIVFYSDSDCD